MKKTIILGLSILFLAGCGLKTPIVDRSADNSAVSPIASASQIANQVVAAAAPVKSSPATTVAPDAWPSSFELTVGFVPQAPFGNWDVLHEETCEEASMIMADEYLKGKIISDQTAEEELQKIVKWETDNGYKVDLTADQVVKVLQDYFSVKAKITTNVTTERIKSELLKGNLVIVPAAGRLLFNPNFKGAGPIYHMLVVKGYDTRNFITNDPGTRKGNGYKYPYQTLINAAHDWNPVLAEGGMTDEEMARGRKVLIIIEK